MAPPFQAKPLVSCPCYPNSVVWSEENLVAIAAGEFITILNPASLFGPRGRITIPPTKPFPIGVVSREDLSTGCLLPTCLSRNTQPCARSISWSHVGLAPNSGCLLAVCTRDGRVKLYRQPFSEAIIEWVEVTDISDLLFDHLVRTDFEEAYTASSNISSEQAAENRRESGGASARHKRKLVNISHETGTFEDQVSYVGKSGDSNGGYSSQIEKQVTLDTKIIKFQSIFKKNISVEVLEKKGRHRVWVNGMIKRISGGKALVEYPKPGKSGKKDEWVELIIRLCDRIKGSIAQNGLKPGQSSPSPKLRPYMDVGNLPEQSCLLKFHNLESILSKGKAVEVWLDDRWVEGLYVGVNQHGLLVKLSGGSNVVSIDAKSVRLAPSWNCSQNLWEVTNVTTKFDDLESDKLSTVKSKKKKVKGTIQRHCYSVPKHGGTTCKKKSENENFTQITARQYVSCNAVLSSTAVAWSPVLHFSSESDCSRLNSLPSYCSFLSVGGKSGKISFWRVHGPQDYSSVRPQDYSSVRDSGSVNVMLVGLLQAHNSWVTAICLEIFSISGASSNSQVVLATGSSDGSVKIWLVDVERLLRSSELNCSSICLLKEVTSASSAPVSVLSATVPAESPEKMLLAVGRASGSLEVWICVIPGCEFHFYGSYDAHIQAVTGLTWAFSGRCLYSCCQDDSLHSWIVHEKSIYETPIPSTSLGLQSSTDISYESNSSFGLAISPGNLVLVVVRGLNAELLDPMYQVRTQKAVAEFFWIGGQQLEYSSEKFSDKDFPGLSEREMMRWESSMIWSLKQFENADKLLVVWDIIAALFVIKHSTESPVQPILVKYLSSWFAGSNTGFSIDNILSRASLSLSNIPSRKLHLLNIICRRFILSGPKADIYSDNENLGGFDDNEQQELWTNLLNISEKILRERLVAFSFSVVLSQKSSSAISIPEGRNWSPVGIVQMGKWVATNHDMVHDQLQLLASELKNLGKRLPSICGYHEEQCGVCSASVPFESPEFAFCVNKKCDVQDLKLARCAVSMQICPLTPLWYCVCCKRSISDLVPQSLFTISELTLDLKSLIGSSSRQVISRPLCPFCGILLQRVQLQQLLPEVLLSATPV